MKNPTNDSILHFEVTQNTKLMGVRVEIMEVQKETFLWRNEANEWEWSHPLPSKMDKLFF